MKNVVRLLGGLALLYGCLNPVDVDTNDVEKYEDGKSLYTQERYNEAVVAFKYVVDEYPWSSKVDNSLEYWGKSLLELNEDSQSLALYDSAISVFSQIPSKSSGYVEALYYEGKILREIYENVESIERDSAVKKLYAVYEKYPKNSYAVKSVEEIVSLFLEDDESDSAKHYADIISLAIDDSLELADKSAYQSARSLYIAATKSDATADYDAAITALKSYKSSSINDSLAVEASHYIGKSYYRSDRYGDALPWFDTVLTSDNVSHETLGEATYRKAYCLMSLKRAAEAVTAFKKYDAEFSGGAYELYTWQYLGELEQETGTESAALSWYEKVIGKDTLCSSDEAALYEAGDLYYGSDSFEKAISTLSKYVERYLAESATKSANAYRLIGHSYRKSGDLNKAFIWFDNGVDDDAFESTTYYDNLLYWAGAVAYDLNDLDGAKEHLQNYVDSYPTGSYITSAQSTLAKINGGY